MSQIGIYCILNSANQKRYIGQGLDLDRRRRAHFALLLRGKHKNFHLQSAWNHYGSSAFLWIIIEVVSDIASLDARECHWIALYAADNPRYGYNAESGGNRNKHPSVTARWNMQKAQNIRRNRDVPEKRSEEFCRKNAEWHKNKVIPDKIREKISESQIKSHTMRKLLIERVL